MNEGYPVPGAEVHDQQDFDPVQFMAELKLPIEHLDHPMVDHEGRMTTFGKGLEECGPARHAAIAQVELFDELGVDRATGMTAYLKKTVDAAERSRPAYEAAKKK